MRTIDNCIHQWVVHFIAFANVIAVAAVGPRRTGSTFIYKSNREIVVIRPWEGNRRQGPKPQYTKWTFWVLYLAEFILISLYSNKFLQKKFEDSYLWTLMQIYVKFPAQNHTWKPLNLINKIDIWGTDKFRHLPLLTDFSMYRCM